MDEKQTYIRHMFDIPISKWTNTEADNDRQRQQLGRESILNCKQT